MNRIKTVLATTLVILGVCFVSNFASALSKDRLSIFSLNNILILELFLSL